MTALKLLGVLAMLLSGGIGAWSAVCYERRRLRVLDGWLDMIRHLRSQIDCYLTPICDVLDTLLPPDTASDLSSLLSATQLYLDEDTRRLLASFANELGGGYREEQLRHCDFCTAELRRKRERIAAELPARQRLSVTLCACLSIGTAILLW